MSPDPLKPLQPMRLLPVSGLEKGKEEASKTATVTLFFFFKKRWNAGLQSGRSSQRTLLSDQQVAFIKETHTSGNCWYLNLDHLFSLRIEEEID